MDGSAQPAGGGPARGDAHNALDAAGRLRARALPLRATAACLGADGAPPELVACCNAALLLHLAAVVVPARLRRQLDGCAHDGACACAANPVTILGERREVYASGPRSERLWRWLMSQPNPADGGRPFRVAWGELTATLEGKAVEAALRMGLPPTRHQAAGPRPGAPRHGGHAVPAAYRPGGGDASAGAAAAEPGGGVRLLGPRHPRGRRLRRRRVARRALPHRPPAGRGGVRRGHAGAALDRAGGPVRVRGARPADGARVRRVSAVAQLQRRREAGASQPARRGAC